MPHGVTLLQDLAVVLLIAGLVTILFHRMKQPVVLGYILAGVILGPHTPYVLIQDEGTINTLSELGVILLMFSLGLEFSLRKLKKVGVPAFIAALMEILLLFWVGYETGQMFHWPVMDSIFLGAMLSMSSTTVIIKVLGELGKMKESFSQLIFGILIIEDILGILMIALLGGIATTGSLSMEAIGGTVGRLVTFLAVVLVIGLIAVPRLIAYVARFKSNEMLVVTVLGLCFGVSLLAMKLGYSVALGAFLIGAVIAEAREIRRIETLIEPVRDMFSAIFFVTIGLLIDPAMLIAHWPPILAITCAVVIGKVLACSFGAFMGGNDTRTSLRVGMGLAQIGEFSFIIAVLGVTLKVTSPFLYPIAVAVSVLTTLLTPYLIRSADILVDRFDRSAPRSLVNLLELYTSWVGHIGHHRNNMAHTLTRKWVAQMVLNALLIAAVFIGAAFLAQHPPASLRAWVGEEWIKASLWLGAMIFSLPMFIATARKLTALGMLLAETRVNADAAGERTAAIQAIVANLVPIAGNIALGLFVLVLSSTLLPPVHVLLILVAIVGLVGWLMWRSFIRVYAKAQAALQETFAQTPIPKADPHAHTLPPLLRDANLEMATLGADSPASGKLLRDTALRTLTGSTIVGIERQGTSLINPSPDEELHPGDHLLLLGSKQQLAAAKEFLGGKDEG